MRGPCIRRQRTIVAATGLWSESPFPASTSTAVTTHPATKTWSMTSDLLLGARRGRVGLCLAARGNKSAKKRALIAVARKLAVLLHRLWLSPIDYDPLRHAEGRNLCRRRRA